MSQSTLESPSRAAVRTFSPKVGFAILLGLLVLAAGAKAIVADTLDPDCFWHLRVGDELSKQSFPHPLVDDLSFASIKTPWTPYSWLAEIGMKKLWDVGGYRAAVATQAIFEAGFLFFLAMSAVELSRARTGEPRYFAAIVATIAGGILSLAYLSYRPVTFALTLLAAIAWLILRDRRMDQKSRALWLVPILTAVVANIHFYSMLVPLWIFALCVGDFIEKRQLKRNGLLFVTSFIASLATPMLPGTLRSVADYSMHDVLVHSPIIAEMVPFYHGTAGHLSAILVGLIILCVIAQLVSHPRKNIGEIFWFSGSLIMLFMLGRMAAVFAIVAVPLFAATMPKISDRLLCKPAIIYASAFLLLLGVYRLAGAFPSENQPISNWLNRHGKDFPAYPCGAADYVDAKIPPVSGRLICEFSWGGYLEWRLGDRFQMLMDGRTQLFDRAFWQKVYFGSLADREGIINSSNADAAIIPIQRSLFRESLTDLHWQSVFKDDFAEVMIPPRN